MGVVEEGALPTQEVPPAAAGWVANKFAQIWFRLDGIWHHLRNERGPDPDWEEDSRRELRDLIQAATREGARRASIDIETYHEGGGGSWNSTTQKVIVALLILGIAGDIAQYAVVASLKQEVTDLRQELNDLKKLVEPRYRGTDP